MQHVRGRRIIMELLANNELMKQDIAWVQIATPDVVITTLQDESETFAR